MTRSLSEVKAMLERRLAYLTSPNSKYGPQESEWRAEEIRVLLTNIRIGEEGGIKTHL